MNSMSRLREAEAIERLVKHDPTLFSAEVDHRQPLLRRLGWTKLAERATARLPLVANLSTAIRSEAVTDVVLLGMGGSSLAPLVMSEVLGPIPGAPTLHVLDTTSPDTVALLIGRLHPSTTAFVLASKSGTTIEPLALYAIFRAWMDSALGRVAAGKRFIAITDPGTPLERRRQKDVMRLAISAPATVGGRFSALSVFGLTPSALIGLPLESVIEHAVAMESACQTPGEDNPAAALAAWMSDAHAAGRDKLTFVASARYASFGLWVEQLVAESTGKQGTGIVPVLEDGSIPVSAYGSDRVLVVLRDHDDAELDALAASARNAHIPVMEYVLRNSTEIGAEFVRWQYAVALTGFLLGVNPFDEPNVTEAKSATMGVLAGEIPVPAALCDINGVWLTFAGGLEGAPVPSDLSTALAPLFASVKPDSGYLAILAYLPRGEGIAALRAAAAELSSTCGFPVCVEEGPRYLHSTGQLHKGGPAKGSFLIITARSRTDLPVPGQPFSLGALHRAQAEGDLVALSARGLPVLRLDLPDASRGLEAAVSAIREGPLSQA